MYVHLHDYNAFQVELPDKIQDTQLNLNFRYIINYFLVLVCPIQYLSYTYTKKKSCNIWDALIQKLFISHTIPVTDLY